MCGRPTIDFEYTRKVYKLSDGVSIATDQYFPPQTTPSSPIVLAIGGFGDSVHRKRSIVSLCKLARNNEFRVIAFHRRGHAGMSFKSEDMDTIPKPYAYIRDDDDFAEVFWHIRNEHPHSKVVLLGLCYGGNTVVRCLNKLPCECGISIACGHDVEKLIDELHPILDAYMTKQHAKIHGDCPSTEKSFKRILEQHYAPAFGYDSLSCMLKDISSYEHLQHVNKPLLLIMSEDDVFTSFKTHKPTKINSNVTLVHTKRGGHLGWVERINDNKPPWHLRVALMFFRRYVV